VLTISSLSEQEELIDLSEDKNPEHYRYKTLRQFINSKKQLTDEEFENYLKLTLNDPDEILGGSATVDLFNDVDLTDIQFQRLCESVGAD
jgi:Fe-S-cluster formation regulator IscX/YfhJ